MRSAKSPRPRKPKAVKPPVPTEAEVTKACVAVLLSRGIPTWRRNVAGVQVIDRGLPTKRVMRVGEKGQSDRWGILPNGAHLELELKRPGKRPTADQVRWLIKTNGIGKSVSVWVDNASTLGRVIDAVLRGARVVYSMKTKTYRRRDGTRDVAPCGDFDLVFPARAGEGKP